MRLRRGQLAAQVRVEQPVRERAAAPNFGVMRAYFELWAKVLLERDHPEVVRLTRRDGARQAETGAELGKGVRQELLDTVRELNRLKTGVAAEITSATLRQVERDLVKP